MIDTKIPVHVLMVFFKELSIMLRVGMSSSLALSIITDIKDKALNVSVSDLKRNIDKGMTLSGAMALQGDTYDAKTIAIVKAGEESAELDVACSDVVRLLEKRARIISKVRGAIFYPSFTAITLVAFLISLPAITQGAFIFGDFVKANGLAIVSVIIALMLAFWALRGKKIKAVFDAIWIKIPVVRQLIFLSDLANSAKTLSFLIKGGVPILRCLELAANVVSNRVIRDAYGKFLDKAKAGFPLGDAAHATNVFPPLFCHMMRVGEETGKLHEILDYISAWYDEELEQTINKITKIIGPIMICFVAFIVLIIVAAVFGPVTTSIVTGGF